MYLSLFAFDFSFFDFLKFIFFAVIFFFIFAIIEHFLRWWFKE